MAISEETVDALSAVDLGVIDQLKTIKQETDVLQERLASMETMKAEFAEAVYHRVRGDYERRIGELEQEANPLKQKAREEYAKLRDELARIETAHQAVTLDRQEIDLRHKLREFDDKEYETRSKAIADSLATRSAERERAQGIRARFLEAFSSEAELEAAPRAKATRTQTRVIEATPAPIESPITTQEVPLPPPVMPAVMPDRTQEMDAVDDEPPARFEPVRAGTTVMPILDMPEPPKVPPPPSVATSAAPAFGPNATMFFRTARLVPQNPEAGRAAIPLPPKPVTLGADSAADIRVGGPGVEPKHATINVSPQGYTIADLGSKHGTRVNAEKVRERLLRHEDVVQIGAARYIFRES